MSASLSQMSAAELARLHGAADEGGLYSVLADILEEQYGIKRFGLYLWNRRREAFLDRAWGGFSPADVEGGTSLPLEVRGQPFGVLRLPPGAKGADAGLSGLCEHLSVALFHHKLLEDQGRLITESLAHVQALKSLGALLGELDEELVLNRLLKFFIDLTGADVGAALLFEDETCLIKARWGLPAQLLPYLHSAGREADQDSPSAGLQVLSLREELTESFSCRTVLRLPLPLQGAYQAELFLVSGDSLPLGPQKRTIVGSCEAIAAIALQNTLDHREQIRQLRLNEQLIVARDIQRQFLPRELPCTQCLAVEGKSVPAQFVGGDYYDVLALENGDLLAIVADVSGKGIQAAMRMSGLRAMLHGQAGKGRSPGELLTLLNRCLCEDALPGHFVSACCALVDRAGRHLRLALAGHEPPVLCGRESPARFLDFAGGLPLGIVADQRYEEFEVELSAGDCLLIYTDGITDTRNADGEHFGTERLIESFRAGGEESAADLLSRVFAEVEAFRGEVSWVDDLTALTFYCKAEGCE